MPIYSQVKPALGLTAQVQHLQNKGIVIADPSRAERFLSFNGGLYRFKGYAHHFKASGAYLPGLTFEMVAELLERDRAVQLLVLEAVQLLEVAVRTQIDETLSAQFGMHWYADQSLFQQRSQRDGFDFDAHAWAAEAYRDFLRSREDFTAHYRSTYGVVELPPSFMVREVRTFGSWSKLFSGLKSPQQASVAMQFGLSAATLRGWLSQIHILRNLAAHHSRLWNRGFRTMPLHDHGQGARVGRLRANSFVQAHPETTLAARFWAMHVLLVHIGVTTWTPKLRQVVASFPPSQLLHLGFRPGWEVQSEWN